MSKPKLSATILLTVTLLSAVVLSFASQTTASDNNPDVEWKNSYGTSEGIPRVVQTNDDSYVFITNAWSYQMTTLPTRLNKIDADGDLVWSIVAPAVDLTQSYDGGYAVLQSISHGAALVKFGSDGQIQWNFTYPNYATYTGKILATSDSGYLIAISNSSNWDYIKVEGSDYRQFTTWLIKTDWFGNVQWTHSYEINGTNNIFTFKIESLIQTSAGDYVIGGAATMNSLDTNACVVKISGNGDLQWIKTYGGDKDDDFSSLCQTSDGNYVLCGTSYSFNGAAVKVYSSNVEGVPPTVNRKTGDEQAWLFKIDSSGKMIWNHTYGVNTVLTDIYGTNDQASARSVMQTSDGKLTFAGSELRVYRETNAEYPMVGGTVTWLVKCDLQGNMLWSADYDQRSQADYDSASYLMETRNGSYLIAGTNSPLIGANTICFLIKTESALPLPTPSPTPIMTPLVGLTSNNNMIETVAIAITILASIAGILLLNVKRKKLKKGNKTQAKP